MRELLRLRIPIATSPPLMRSIVAGSGKSGFRDRNRSHPALPPQGSRSPRWDEGKRIALPVTKIAAVVLVVELCQVRRGVDREEGLSSTTGRLPMSVTCVFNPITPSHAPPHPATTGARKGYSPEVCGLDVNGRAAVHRLVVLFGRRESAVASAALDASAFSALDRRGIGIACDRAVERRVNR